MAIINKDELIPTHNCLRNPYWFINARKNNIYIDKRVTILLTEDGKKYILDGHHRLCLMDVRNEPLLESDVKFVKYTYKEMNEHNIDLGYVTPFDPRYECRHDNFLLFKLTVLKLIPDYMSKFELGKFIRDSQNIYKEPRKVYCIKDLYVNLGAC